MNRVDAARARWNRSPRLLGGALVAAALLIGGASAQMPPAPTAAPAPVADTVVLVPPKDAPVPLLWKVSDADNAVYLLGSFHLLRPDDYPLADDVNRAFADSAAVLFELPPDEMSSPQLGLQMAQAAMQRGGATLDAQLTPATREKLQAWIAANAAALQPLGLNAERMQLFEPWYVGLLISIVEMNKAGLDPKLGIDEHFMAAAAAAHKATDGFETGASQIALLDGMSRDEQLQFLDEALTDAAGGGNEIAALHAAWRSGDEALLRDKMALDMQREYPALYRRINVERNDAWVPKIEALLAAPGTDNRLVVVGALHLLGSDGVVEKLRAKGYAVERVCSMCVVAPVPAAVPQPTPR